MDLSADTAHISRIREQDLSDQTCGLQLFYFIIGSLILVENNDLNANVVSKNVLKFLQFKKPTFLKECLKINHV